MNRYKSRILTWYCYMACIYHVSFLALWSMNATLLTFFRVSFFRKYERDPTLQGLNEEQFKILKHNVKPKLPSVVPSYDRKKKFRSPTTHPSTNCSFAILLLDNWKVCRRSEFCLTVVRLYNKKNLIPHSNIVHRTVPSYGSATEEKYVDDLFIEKTIGKKIAWFAPRSFF